MRTIEDNRGQSRREEKAHNTRTSRIVGRVWPPPQRQTFSISKNLFPAAQLHHLSNRLPRQRNRIAFAANPHEHVRERHGRAAQLDVACLVARVSLLSANRARCRCYVAFMPWCLHNLSLYEHRFFLFLSFCSLDMETLRKVCRLVSKQRVLTKPLQCKHAAYFRRTSLMSAKMFPSESL